MDIVEVEFVQTTRRLGLDRAQSIIALLMAYEGNVTKTAKALSAKKAEFVPINSRVSAKEQAFLDDELTRHEAAPVLNSIGIVKQTYASLVTEFVKANPGMKPKEVASIMYQKNGGNQNSWYVSCYNSSNKKSEWRTLRLEDGKLYPL